MFGWQVFAPKSIVLSGMSIVLRPPRRRDYQEWSALRRRNQNILRAREPQWPPDALTRRYYRRYVREYRLAARYALGYGFLVFRADNSQLMGGVHLTQIRRGAAQMGTLGYWLGEEFQGHGYMREAVALVCDFAFTELGLHRLEAACMLDNAASQTVLTVNGFAHEGRAKNYLQINGHWVDHELFGLGSEDWAS
jgi:ribosomal-protein-alanine N-acetyltransferase